MSQRFRVRAWTARVLAGALAAGLAAGACGDGPTEPAVDAGTISFAYSGAETGSFYATGPISPSKPPPQEGAAAFTDPDFGMTVIIGVRARRASRADLIQLFLPRVTRPATFNLDPMADEACHDSTAAGCPFAVVGLDVPIDGPGVVGAEPPDNVYFVTEGLIVVTSVSATRITGTFRGKGWSLALPGDEREIVVSNGTFDVAVSALRDP